MKGAYLQKKHLARK